MVERVFDHIEQRVVFREHLTRDIEELPSRVVPFNGFAVGPRGRAFLDCLVESRPRDRPDNFERVRSMGTVQALHEPALMPEVNDVRFLRGAEQRYGTREKRGGVETRITIARNASAAACVSRTHRGLRAV